MKRAEVDIQQRLQTQIDGLVWFRADVILSSLVAQTKNNEVLKKKLEDETARLMSALVHHEKATADLRAEAASERKALQACREELV